MEKTSASVWITRTDVRADSKRQQPTKCEQPDNFRFELEHSARGRRWSATVQRRACSVICCFIESASSSGRLTTSWTMSESISALMFLFLVETPSASADNFQDIDAPSATLLRRITAASPPSRSLAPVFSQHRQRSSSSVYECRTSFALFIVQDLRRFS